MTSRAPDVDDVLEAFAAEPDTGDATLTAYVQRYPAFAASLVEYARELRLAEAADAEDAAPDPSWLEASWHRFEAASNAAASAETPVVDPYASVAPAQVTAIRKELGLPATIWNAFRDRLVVFETVPSWLASRLAALLEMAEAEFATFQALPPRLRMAQQHKSDTAPTAPSVKVTFEELLDECLLSGEQRASLLRGPD